MLLAALILLVNLVLGLTGVAGRFEGPTAIGFACGEALFAPLLLTSLFMIGKRFRSVKSAATVFCFVSLLVGTSLWKRANEDMDPARLGSLLEAVAERTNRELPLQIDDETELTSVESEGGVIIYNHTLTSAEESESNPAFREFVEPQVIEHACSLKHLRNGLLAKGATVRYRYRDLHGNLLLETDIDKFRCWEVDSGSRDRPL